MAGIKIIECPRDAMQGIPTWIPTEDKIRYLNALLKVGFDTLDFGSFVSPKAIPQLKDTAEVYKGLGWNDSSTQLLAIVANLRGAELACLYSGIKYLGFPLSLSETFQKRNTNSSIEDAFGVVESIQSLCLDSGKEQLVYLSMGFGNPYGEQWDAETVNEFIGKLKSLGVRIIALSDTIGVADPQRIHYIFSAMIEAYPDLEFGAHLHSRPELANEKVHAAIEAGCKRFDGAIRGFGGCPMAKDDLVGNLDTRVIIEVARKKNLLPSTFSPAAFSLAEQESQSIFQ